MSNKEIKGRTGVAARAATRTEKREALAAGTYLTNAREARVRRDAARNLVIEMVLGIVSPCRTGKTVRATVRSRSENQWDKLYTDFGAIGLNWQPQHSDDSTNLCYLSEELARSMVLVEVMPQREGRLDQKVKILRVLPKEVLPAVGAYVTE